jgi:hypothetical protein
MLRQEDLDAAVAAAIVTKAQAQALRDFAAKRERARDALLGHEERFRFMRGFNDFFFATGVVMLGAGMMYFAGPGSGGNLAAAVVVWGLAELLVRRMRLVLPGLLLACFFVALIYRAIPADVIMGLMPDNFLISSALTAAPRRLPVSWLDMVFGAGGAGGLAIPPAVIAVKALVAGGAAALFYGRFRLPFALLPVAASLVVTVTAATREIGGPAVQSLVLLLCGLGVFAAAMSFDMSDRERATRRADCAFWLHLLAAPLIVHSLISMIVPSVSALTMTASVALVIVAIATVLALVAVVIDRRALLVSTFSYLGIVIAYAITTARATAPADPSAVFFSTLAVLGILVLGLGVGWQPLRRALISILPTAAVDRLPPAVQAA